MKKLSLVLGLAFVGTFAFAQQKVNTNRVSAPVGKPAPTATVTPAPAPTTSTAPAPTTVNNAPVNSSSDKVEYVPGNEKQTSPSYKQPTNSSGPKPLIVTHGVANKPGTTKSQTLQK